MTTNNTDSSEVLAYCGSCKMDLMATVVAKVGSKIAKVQCNTCKKERAFKPAKGIAEPGQEATKKTSSSKTKKSSSKDSESENKSIPIEAEWNRLMKEAEKLPRVKYSPKAKLSLGDVISHPTFGDGVVMRLGHPDKAEILFQKDLKLLIHSR